MGLALETSATTTLNMQLTAGTGDTQTMQFGMNAVKTVCCIKSYFNMRMELFIKVTRTLTSTHSLTHSHTSVCAVVFSYLFTRHGNLSVGNGKWN